MMQPIITVHLNKTHEVREIRDRMLAISTKYGGPEAVFEDLYIHLGDTQIVDRLIEALTIIQGRMNGAKRQGAAGDPLPDVQLGHGDQG